ncbi:MAG: hypothetical protein PARBA_03539 [Parabacteroides sp.]
MEIKLATTTEEQIQRLKDRDFTCTITKGIKTDAA